MEIPAIPIKLLFQCFLFIGATLFSYIPVDAQDHSNENYDWYNISFEASIGWVNLNHKSVHTVGGLGFTNYMRIIHSSDVSRTQFGIELPFRYYYVSKLDEDEFDYLENHISLATLARWDIRISNKNERFWIFGGIGPEFRGYFQANDSYLIPFIQTIAGLNWRINKGSRFLAINDLGIMFDLPIRRKDISNNMFFLGLFTRFSI